MSVNTPVAVSQYTTVSVRIRTGAVLTPPLWGGDSEGRGLRRGITLGSPEKILSVICTSMQFLT